MEVWIRMERETKEWFMALVSHSRNNGSVVTITLLFVNIFQYRPVESVGNHIAISC